MATPSLHVVSSGDSDSLVLLHVPHASRHIPRGVRAHLLLSPAALALELDRVTDTLTDVMALEAAAAGTPLATSDVGGLGEAVIDGVTGLSFPPRDVAALAEAVRAVLDDPDAAQRRAVAARERLTSDFDWHTVATRTAQVYLAAKRREREPHPRRPIVEHPLLER